MTNKQSNVLGNMSTDTPGGEEPMPVLQEGASAADLIYNKIGPAPGAISNMTQLDGLEEQMEEKKPLDRWVLCRLINMPSTLAENPLPAYIQGYACSFPMDSWVLVPYFVPYNLGICSYIATFKDNQREKIREFFQMEYVFDIKELMPEFQSDVGAERFLRMNDGKVLSAVIQQRGPKATDVLKKEGKNYVGRPKPKPVAAQAPPAPAPTPVPTLTGVAASTPATGSRQASTPNGKQTNK